MAHSSSEGGRPSRVAFVVSEAISHDENKGDAQLEKDLERFEAPPERERPLRFTRGN